MRVLSDSDLLAAWERGRVAMPRAGSVLSLLSAAYPEEPMEALGLLSIGKRDALLMALREQLFGLKVVGLSDCEACREPLEIELDLSAMTLAGAEVDSDSLSVEWDGFEVEFRLPNSLDLIAISDLMTVEAAREKLLRRVMISAQFEGEGVSANELPEVLVEKMESRMSESEPQAEIELNVVCGACRERNRTLFDISSFLWKEVDTWAIRLLREIHELARAYGWTEAEIVNMNPWRRRCYLEMLGI